MNNDKIVLSLKGLSGIIIIFLLKFIFIVFIYLFSEYQFKLDLSSLNGDDMSSFIVLIILNFVPLAFFSYLVNLLFFDYKIKIISKIRHFCVFFFEFIFISLLLVLIEIHFTGNLNYKYVFVPFQFIKAFPIIVFFVGFQVISEEYLFRGIITTWLNELITNKYLVVFLSSLIFASFHTRNELVLNNHFYIILPFLSGVLYNYFYIDSNSLTAPIAFHFSNNFISYLILGDKFQKPFWGLYLFDSSRINNAVVNDIIMQLFLVTTLISIHQVFKKPEFV